MHPNYNQNSLKKKGKKKKNEKEDKLTFIIFFINSL